MPTQSNIRDNHKRGTVANFIREQTTPDTHLRVVSAYFTIHAYAHLKHHLENLEGVEFLFGEPAFLSKVQELERAVAMVREDGLVLSDQLRQGALARACAEWIREKVTIRSVREGRLSHGKLYHFERGEVQKALLGSSNFTVAGLGLKQSGNLELNTIVDSDRDKRDLKQWFCELFTDDTVTEDVTDTVLATLERLYRHNAPEFVYYKTLFHLFDEELQAAGEDEFGQFSTQLVDSQVWAQLYDFQRDAVTSLIRTMKEHNGAVLADSVGLGKTFTALAVIKHYELRNARVLVLCPKKLRSNWTKFMASAGDRTNPFPDDRFNYTVLSHTDLGREQGLVGDVDLERFNWGAYDLVVIDESHAFRNDKPAPKGSGRKTRYEWLMEKVLREGVNTNVLLLSATPVNNDLTDLRSQLRLITAGKDTTLSSVGIKHLGSTIAKAQRAFTTWIKETDRNPAALMESLGSDFFTLLDTLTIARSRQHVRDYYPETYDNLGGFPTRAKPVNKNPVTDTLGALRYERINDEILQLNLAIYHPTDYILPDYYDTYGISHETGFDQRARESSLVEMMKTNYLKRLESSVASFHATMTRALAKHDDLITTLEGQQASTVEAGEVEFEDEDDAVQAELVMGAKLRVQVDHLDVERWLQVLREDRERVARLLDVAAQVTPDRDGKLEELKRIIREKAVNPSLTRDARENRKVLVFTAFADTASYLYEQVVPLVQELGLHAALVTGDVNRSTLHRSDFESILTNFSPRSKDRERLTEFPQDQEIDVLIATDCISEGQNLQDCDLVVNYDIHWNPVRIVQRFGRIDRLGSMNSSVKLTNFWPTEDLNAYLELKQRVEGRMALVDLTATGSDNLLTPEEQVEVQGVDADYRAKQLERLREQVIDLEEFDDSLNLQDFSLGDFRADLLHYLRAHRDELLQAPAGLFAVAGAPAGQEVVKPGVIFCLKQVTTGAGGEGEAVNPLQPYYLVYVREDGVVRYSFTHPKQVLTIFRAAAQGHSQPIVELCRAFDERTECAQDLSLENRLLDAALEQVRRSYVQRAAATLLGGRGAALPAASQQVTEESTFELITWLVLEGVAPSAQPEGQESTL